ncbi:MAG: pantoate--beta-alanine ligase [Gammaproteobacteria bacterium]|nr:pantoate--beta-alanine ligase [Gammaproteobacteria bacterium]MDH5239430.1 pantoate--beta-alanine ligase [Gammaproteobacteria bacterium]MDH5260032.1 pantoate--beta-alanine ligase [Gammaproteobacteria bacterium]MDH5582899.1 pantoate--beta-alanine ligase [Gammaproteobacteria bacterium]
MIIAKTREELLEQLADWRQHGDRIALVPTMGNLHSGHMSLVKLAREHAERVVVSIFVNPTQFSEDEDFEEYPRTFERDTRRLKKPAADLIFAPEVETIYPFGLTNATTVSVPRITENFCGASRPGHFDGVTSVVVRLFALVQPDVAVFGQKDYQQQLVIRHMSQDLNLPISIITAQTVREADGLAMSSRNLYLNDEERKIAPALYKVLSEIGTKLQDGRRDFEALEAESAAKLTAAGFVVDYFAIRRAMNLEMPDRDCDELVVLAAAQLGHARLIDNVVITI